jgi:hypothetical protein
MILVGWIRIRVGNADDPNPEAKKMTQKLKKFSSFKVRMFSFEG